MRAWSPARLYTAGEPGAWYDPSDMSTLYQDSAGTTPVTASGQPVGLWLDKSKQRGWTDVTGAVWTKTAGDGVLTVSGNQITVTGATTPTLITRTAGSIPFLPGQAKMVCRADWSTAAGVQVWLRGSPVALASGVETARMVSLNNSSLERFDVGSGNVTFTVSTFSVWLGNHASQDSGSKRPLYTDVGGRKSLSFDGVDDALVTRAIDFTGTDKMTVAAGVRKLIDGSYPVVAELSRNSDTQNGAFLLAASRSAALSDYFYQTRGSGGAFAVSGGLPAPRADVIAAESDISGDVARLRVNGVLRGSSASDQGAGSFGSYSLYIGGRSGLLSYFNGHLYGLIVRGAATSAADIAAAEQWLNRKTGAF